jgi:hypothetical protein
MNQYFIIKIKDEFLPEVIIEYIKNGKICADENANYRLFPHTSRVNIIYYIDKKYFRKLKIQSIENSISENEKQLLEFLINKNINRLLTQEEYNTNIINKHCHYIYCG